MVGPDIATLSYRLWRQCACKDAKLRKPLLLGKGLYGNVVCRVLAKSSHFSPPGREVTDFNVLAAGLQVVASMEICTIIHEVPARVDRAGG